MTTKMTMIYHCACPIKHAAGDHVGGIHHDRVVYGVQRGKDGIKSIPLNPFDGTKKRWVLFEIKGFAALVLVKQFVLFTNEYQE